MLTWGRPTPSILMSVVLIASVWTTALVTTFLAHELLEALSFLYAAVTTSLMLVYLVRSRNRIVRFFPSNNDPLSRSRNESQDKLEV